MARRKIKSATDQRKFTIVYNDFLESELLDKHEKLIYIAIKRFADNDTLKAFPSLKTLHKITGISIRWIKKSIEHMEQLGVISVEHREDDEKGHQSNLYTLYDYAEIWNVGSSEDVAAVADEISEAKLVAELRARGYTVIKEKEPDKLSADQSIDNESSTNKNHICKDYNTVKQSESQVEERWSMERIKQHYDYDILLNQKPYEKDTIDGYMDLLYDLLNEKREYITISGNKIPVDIVWSRLEKLYYEHILYCMKQMGKQTTRIHSTKEYKKKLLYEAYTQMNDDISNQVQHDMYNWKPPTE